VISRTNDDVTGRRRRMVGEEGSRRRRSVT